MVKYKLHIESRNVTMSKGLHNRNFILTIRKFLFCKLHTETRNVTMSKVCYITGSEFSQSESYFSLQKTQNIPYDLVCYRKESKAATIQDSQLLEIVSPSVYQDTGPLWHLSRMTKKKKKKKRSILLSIVSLAAESL